MRDQIKFLLDEEELPHSWYNIIIEHEVAVPVPSDLLARLHLGLHGSRAVLEHVAAARGAGARRVNSTAGQGVRFQAGAYVSSWPSTTRQICVSRVPPSSSG